MIKRAFYQCFRAGLAIFFEQVLFERTSVDADSDGAAIGLRRVHHFLDPCLAADVARIDAQAGRARVGGFQCALIMKMNVRDDGYARGANDLPERSGRFLIGAGHPDRSEEHTSELQSLMRTSYAVFCLKKKK